MYTVKEVGISEWDSYIDKCQKINMLQSWQYGDAKQQSSRWKAIRFKVLNDKREVIAIMQLLSMALPIIGGVARMNRGPLLIGDVDLSLSEKIAANIIAALIQESKKRRWWLIQIAPEMKDTENASKYLSDLGLIKQDVAPSASGLVLLEPDEESLIMGFKGKWRNCLRKGQKLGVSITIKEGDSSDLSILLKSYQQLQNAKGFSGLPDNLISALAKQSGNKWQFTLYIAIDKSLTELDKTVGMLVGIRHGDTATYIIGSSNDTGRKLQANYTLLWKAILHSKEIGCKWFDIGGLNATTPSGIAHFKKGVNSEIYSLIGEWRMFIFPWTKTQ